MSLQKNRMIAASKNFQTSVNIAFDFDNAQKLADFIPTSEAIKFIDEAVLSARNINQTEEKTSEKNDSLNRAGILIGPYGKGKSYIVLETLSLLYNNPDLKNVFESLAKKIAEKNPDAAENVRQYVKSGTRLLPVVINGNSQSLAQSFLYALHLTLKNKEFENLMPETHFESAVKMIEKWENEYPETLEKFNNLASVKSGEFKRQLLTYNSDFFAEFEKLYPSLTSGSEFNPFSGFDVVEVYEKVCKKLCETGNYDGIFVVYDEFGKYLESSIAQATVKDTKLLQDFAERCDRSGKNQLHLLLICHKEIENYIDILPKQKVDGWKGVSERFRHIHLYNENYSEVYSLISAAILKNPAEWKNFCAQNEAQFENLKNVWFGGSSRLFSNLEGSFADTILCGCYPLHPATSYILPRLSEKAAQNERTLFTFLSGNDKNGFSSLIEKLGKTEKTESGENEFLHGGKIILFTPDVLFDYFENQLQNEPYTSEIKKNYLMAVQILRQLEKTSLEAKIVKTISLIYCLNQFERLSPDLNFLFELYDDAGYSREEIRGAVKTLSEKGFVYLNIHNNYIQLKANSGANIPALISDCVEKRRRSVRIVDILNNFNTEKFIYPTSYNVKNKMTRYFRFAFISENDFMERGDWKNTAENFNSDGCVFAVFNDSESAEKNQDDKKNLVEKACKISSETKNLVFIFSKSVEKFTEKLRRFDSVAFLRNELLSSFDDTSDSVLFDEYDIIYQDLYEVVKQIVHSYIQPERKLALYVSLGAEKKLYRKSDLTNLVSQICGEIFYRTPVINNEMLNKNCLTGAATKSRAKLMDAMLNFPLNNLGFSGSGQEVSFMQSALVHTGILEKNSEKKFFNLSPKTGDTKNDKNFKNLFRVMNGFLSNAEKTEASFEKLFDLLEKPENGIGLRRGVIPVYIAVAVCERVKNIVLKKRGIEVPVNAQNLAEIAETPSDFTILIQKWNDEKENYILALEKLFSDFVIDDEKKANGYSYLINAMFRWYRSLPKYTKQMKKVYCGGSGLAEIKFAAIQKEYSAFLNILRSGGFGANEILFEKLPFVFGNGQSAEYFDFFENVAAAKKFFDFALDSFESQMIEETKNSFDTDAGGKSLKNLVADFCQKLNLQTENHVFKNGAHSLLRIYKSAGNDEKKIVMEMSKVLTGLSIDDWNDESVNMFFERLSELNGTLLDFDNRSVDKRNMSALRQAQCPADNTENPAAENVAGAAGEYNSVANYEIRFAQSGTESAKSKSFKKVECSVRAKSLEEEIWRTIEEMGQSVTDAEKRQVLVSLLEKLC